MKTVHNFYAGPCVLPGQAVEAAIEALKDFSGTGLSVIEISHRSKEWEAVMDECRSLWKELLHIPDTHEVVFLGGGASMEFLYVVMNFLEKKAGYLETGVWAKKALKEAKGFAESKGAEAFAVASSADKTYSYIPKGYEIPKDLDYFHITTNNTIYGTEIAYDMDCPVPLIADMSSDLRRSSEKCRPGRSQLRHYSQGCSRKGVALHSDNAELSDPHRWKINVQHPARVPYICDEGNPQVAQGAGGCRGHQ